MPAARAEARPPRYQPGRVPMQFVGLARQLRDKITAHASAYNRRTGDLLAPLRPRAGFTPFPRHERLRQLAEQWHAIRSACQLRTIADFDPSTGFRVIEVLVEPAKVTLPGWDDADAELALRVMVRHVRIQPPEFRDDEGLCAIVGLHALARRFERGEPRGERAVLDDLLPLGRAFVDAVQADNLEVSVPAGGGTWKGTIMIADSVPNLAVRTLAVRTFVAGAGG
jgi:hypothetical protein